MPPWPLSALMPRAASAGHSVGRGAGCGGAHVLASREGQGPSPSPQHPEALVQFMSLNCSLTEPPRGRASPEGSESANECVLVLRAAAWGQGPHTHMVKLHAGRHTGGRRGGPTPPGPRCPWTANPAPSGHLVSPKGRQGLALVQGTPILGLWGRGPGRFNFAP